MQLEHHGEPAVGQAIDEMNFPQRTAAVQRSARDVADDLIQLPPTAGTGHADAAQVVVELDLAILQPHRMVQLEWHLYELVPQGIQQRQPPPYPVAEYLEVEVTIEVGGIDDDDLESVGRDIGGFAVQQHGIPAVESLHCSLLVMPSAADHVRKCTTFGSPCPCPLIPILPVSARSIAGFDESR